MPINKNLPLGAVHIKLPFKSMDDVEFSGAYAPLADKLVETLQAHLSKQAPEEDDSNSTESTDTTESDDGPDMEQLRKGPSNAQ